MARYDADGMTKAQVAASLDFKRGAIYASVAAAAEEASVAFDEAAAVVRTM